MIPRNYSLVYFIIAEKIPVITVTETSILPNYTDKQIKKIPDGCANTSVRSLVQTVSYHVKNGNTNYRLCTAKTGG